MKLKDNIPACLSTSLLPLKFQSVIAYVQNIFFFLYLQPFIWDVRSPPLPPRTHSTSFRIYFSKDLFLVIDFYLKKVFFLSCVINGISNSQSIVQDSTGQNNRITPCLVWFLCAYSKVFSFMSLEMCWNHSLLMTLFMFFTVVFVFFSQFSNFNIRL